MKKIRFTSLLLFLLSQLIFAKEFHFNCPIDDIPEAAKGSYYFDTISQIFTYKLNDQRINIMQLVNNTLQPNVTINYPYHTNYFPGYNESDFIQFDNNGNVYLILIKHEPNINSDSVIVIKYDPQNNTAETFIPDFTLLPKAMAVSDDGKWIFICGSKDYEHRSGDGIPIVIAIPTENPTTYEVLFELKINKSIPAFFYNLCFDSITKSLYFTHLGWIKEYDACIGQGLYVAKPDINNYYSKETVQRHSNIGLWTINKFITYSKQHNLPTYNLALQEIKECCGYNLNYDNIELSLKNFKDINISLYKEDTNGNPLTDEAAMKFLFEEQFDLFKDFVSDNTWNNGCKGYCSSFPLDLLCLDKTTGQSAYKGNKTYLKNRASEEIGYIFSTNFGLFINTKREDGNNYSELHQITDKNGNFVTTNEITGSYRLNSIYDSLNRSIIPNKNFLIFLPLDKTNLYLLESNSLTSLSSKYPDCEEFTMEQAKEVESELLNEAIIQTGLEAELNKLKTSTSLKIVVLTIMLAVSFFIILFLLIICIIKPSIKKTMLDKIHIFRIKRDKKYVFDIQEKERGKISRDIHDSIIQDIRAIRLNTEMLNVDEASQSRKQLIINTATNCVINLRNICYNLTPAELATHIDGDNSKIELISIIQTLVTQFIEKTHVPCSIQIEENFSYPIFEKETSQNLFRIIQESLTNIEKHSYATKCSIYIKEKTDNDKKYMTVYISDDGIGCDIKKLLARKKKMHFGLQNMIARAELIGAQIEFRSEQGDGMEIIISVPEI